MLAYVGRIHNLNDLKERLGALVRPAGSGAAGEVGRCFAERYRSPRLLPEAPAAGRAQRSPRALSVIPAILGQPAQELATARVWVPGRMCSAGVLRHMHVEENCGGRVPRGAGRVDARAFCAVILGCNLGEA